MVNSVVIDIKGTGGGTRVPPNNLVLLDGNGYESPPQGVHFFGEMDGFGSRDCGIDNRDRGIDSHDWH